MTKWRHLDAYLAYKTPFPVPFEPSYVYAPSVPYRSTSVVFTAEDFKPLRKQRYMCLSCMTVAPYLYYATCGCPHGGAMASVSQALGWL